MPGRRARVPAAFWLASVVAIPTAHAQVELRQSRMLTTGGTVTATGVALYGRIGSGVGGASSGDGVESLGGQATLVAGASSMTLVSAPASVPTAGTATLEVRVATPGFVAPSDVLVRAAPGGSRSPSATVTLVAQGDGTFAGDIPASAFADARGVDYEVASVVGPLSLRVRDAANDAPLRIETELDEFAPGGPLDTPAVTYGMVGFPVALASTDPADVLEELGTQDETTWRFARFDPDTESYREYDGTAPSVDPLDPGNAFWLITRNATSVGVSGLSRAPQALAPGTRGLEIELQPGWNQIASPFAFDVDPDEIVVIVDGESLTWAEATGDQLEASPLQAFDGTTYAAAAVLEPWTGYFVNNLDDDVMTWRVPYAERDAGRPRTPSPAPAWSARVTVSDGERGIAHVDVGLDRDAALFVDDFDVLAAPTPPGGRRVQVAVDNDAYPPHARLLARDVRPSFPGFSGRWTLEVTSAAGATVRLGVDGLEELPAGVGARMLDLDGERQVELWPAPSPASYAWTSSPGATRRALVLLVGDDAYLAEETEAALLGPSVFALSHVRPNPVRGSAYVSFSLPGSQRTDLRVFDVQGRHVRTLLSRRMAPGRHVVVWDRRNDRGAAVAPGVYMVRLRAEDRAETRRIVLVN